MLPSGPFSGAFVQPIIHSVFCPHKAINGGDLYSTPDLSDVPCCLPFLILALLRFGLTTSGVNVGSGILSCNSISLHWLIGAIGALITSLPSAIGRVVPQDMSHSFGASHCNLLSTLTTVQ
jgi:hypothetical protein